LNILFLCSANIHRSKTAETLFQEKCSGHTFKSAGLSEKYCRQYGSQLCTTELLDWAEQVYVMEEMHVQRIAKYAGEHYLEKVKVLGIEDIYQYMQPELIEKLLASQEMVTTQKYTKHQSSQ